MLYREAGDFKTSYAADSATFPIPFDRVAFWTFTLVAFVAVPMLINGYWANAVFIPFLVFSMAALGLNILQGYCGQVSLGTGGFMCVGAYAAYKFMTAFEWLPIPVIIIPPAPSYEPAPRCRAAPRAAPWGRRACRSRRPPRSP